MKLSDLKVDTPEKEMAVRNCQMFVRCGSVMYGTNVPGKSDSDFVGFFMPDEKYNLGLSNVGHVEFRTNSTASGKRNTTEDVDCTLYSLKHLVNMLLNNNPTALELFFVPENCQLHMTPLAKKLMAASASFVSKKSYHTFKGYAHQQRARMERTEENKGGRQELIQKYGFDCKLASHNLRLHLEAIELLSTGTLQLPLKRNSLVLSCKKGEMTKEQFFAEADKLGFDCDSVYATCKLPHNPDQDAVEKLVVELNKDFYGYNLKSKSNSVKKVVAEFLRGLANTLD